MFGFQTDLLFGEAEAELAPQQEQADAGAALRVALKRLAPLMASHAVQAELVAPAGLQVPMRAAALAELLEDFLSAAVQAAPASRILLTADEEEGWVHVTLTDDMPNVDAGVRRAAMRGLTHRVAGRGGALDIDVHPDEGTTLTLCLPAMQAPGPARDRQRLNSSAA